MIKTIIGILGLIITGPCHAHEATSGWRYPHTCCGEKDCRPVSCGTIIDHADGSVEWLGLHFFAEQVMMSGDASCHVCVTYALVKGVVVRVPHCIFLAPTM